MKALFQIVGLLVFVCGNLNSTICAEEATQLTFHDADDYHTRWAPDGKSILFTSRRGGSAGIWRVSWPRGKPVALETGMEGDHHISWSPDGSKIVFDARSQNAPQSLWIIPSTGGNPIKLEGAGTPSFQPSWSPDGLQIVYCSLQSGNCDIWIISVQTGEVVQLTDNEATNNHPAWTPDGREIIYSSNQDGDFDIWKVPASGGEPVCLWDSPGLDDHPRCSPDGRILAFTSTNADVSVLTLLALETGKTIPLIQGQGIGWPCWSPDGKMIGYVTREAGNSDIWVIKAPKL